MLSANVQHGVRVCFQFVDATLTQVQSKTTYSDLKNRQKQVSTFCAFSKFAAQLELQLTRAARVASRSAEHHL
jgi:hypothetical protein